MILLRFLCVLVQLLFLIPAFVAGLIFALLHVGFLSGQVWAVDNFNWALGRKPGDGVK